MEIANSFIIYFKYKDQFEIDNRLFTNYLIAEKEAIRLGKLFDINGEASIIFSSPKRHIVFSSPIVQVYILELSSYPKL
jgi:hypothetical protein